MLCKQTIRLRLARVGERRMQRRPSQRWPVAAALISGIATAFATTVNAQPVDPVSAPASAAPSYVDISAARSRFNCAPAPVGNGTLPVLRSNAAGTVAWWYCPMPGNVWRLNWAAATAAQLALTNLAAQAQEVISSNDSMATFNAIVAKNLSLPLSDASLAAVWQPFMAQMIAGAPSTR